MRKELKECVKQIKSNLKELIDIAEVLTVNGYPITHVSLITNKHVINCRTLKEVGKVKRDLRKMFSDKKVNFTFSKWSKYKNYIVCEWLCNEIRTAIWLHTTVEEDPTKKPDDKCKFVKQKRTEYLLVCDKED